MFIGFCTVWERFAGSMTKNINSDASANITTENRYIDYSSYQDPRRRNEIVIECDDLLSSTDLDISNTSSSSSYAIQPRINVTLPMLRGCLIGSEKSSRMNVIILEIEEILSMMQLDGSLPSTTIQYWRFNIDAVQVLFSISDQPPPSNFSNRELLCG